MYSKTYVSSTITKNPWTDGLLRGPGCSATIIVVANLRGGKKDDDGLIASQILPSMPAMTQAFYSPGQRCLAVRRLKKKKESVAVSPTLQI